VQGRNQVDDALRKPLETAALASVLERWLPRPEETEDGRGGDEP